MLEDKKKLWTLALVAAVLIAGVVWVARADAEGISKSGLVPIGEVASATAPWTGFYVGGGAGVQLLDANSGRTFDVVDKDGKSLLSYDKIDLSPLSSTFAEGLGGSGTTLDARAGFDVQLPGTPIVLGALGGYRWGDVGGSFGYGLLNDLVSGSASFSIEPTWYLGGRAGFAHQKWLGYVGAAWTQAEASGTINGALTIPGVDAADQPTPVRASRSASLNGMMYMAGMEYQLSSNWSIGLEYTYTNYDAFRMTADTSISDDPTDPKLRHTLSVDPDVHTVMARVNWRPFGK